MNNRSRQFWGDCALVRLLELVFLNRVQCINNSVFKDSAVFVNAREYLADKVFATGHGMMSTRDRGQGTAPKKFKISVLNDQILISTLLDFFLTRHKLLALSFIHSQ